jgi:hypothetical protein
MEGHSRSVERLPQPQCRAPRMTRHLVPDKCILCGTVGSVEFTARTPRGAAALFWYCHHCEYVWPIEPDEHGEERRSGPADRRRQTRADRRKRSEDEIRSRSATRGK